MAEDTTNENTVNEEEAPKVFDDDGLEITDLTDFEKAQIAAAPKEEDEKPAASSDATTDDDAVAAAAAAEAAATAGAASTDTYTVKVAGENREVSLEDLKANFAHGEGAQEKMQEAANMKKQAVEFIQALKDDPLKILMDPRLGLDFGAIVDKVNDQRETYKGLTEEQQQLQLAQQKIQRFQEQEEVRKQQDADAFQAQQVTDITNQIESAISQGGLPNNTFVFNRYIEYLQNAQTQGINVSPTGLTEMVKEDYQEALKEMLGQTEVPDVINLLGDKIKDIRKYEVDAIKNDTGKTTKPAEKVTKKTASNESDLQSLEDFKESLGIWG